MRVHITNIYGMSFTSTALKAQNQMANIATGILNFNELGIYHYDIKADSPENLSKRLDGIIASVGWGDIVFLQFPTWNGIQFDKALVERLQHYRGLKKIFFVHDIPPLMFRENRYLLNTYIDFYNQADLIILPSQRMADFLYSEGLTVKKIVIQKMWDFPVNIDQTVTPQFKKIINFAGNPDYPKFEFVKRWNYDTVRLNVTVNEGDWAEGKNIGFLGWFNDDTFLVNALRNNGGFGLVWSEEPYCLEYMKLNANYKLGAYLAAGIPVIVNKCIAESDTIIHKNLGLAVDSLDEAVNKVSNMKQEEYNKMAEEVASFSNLIRYGYFAKRALTDAVFKLLYD